MRKSKYTLEQIKWLRTNIKGVRLKTLTQMFNDHFNSSFTELQIRAVCRCNNFRNHLSCGFSPNKIGDTKHNYRGDVIIKVSTKGNYYNQWKLKKNVIWKAANGRIPKNHSLILLDGNKDNLELDNIACVSQSILISMGYKKLFFKDKESTKTGIAIAEHFAAVMKRLGKNKSTFMNRVYRKRKAEKKDCKKSAMGQLI
jgi:hypothetical protein